MADSYNPDLGMQESDAYALADDLVSGQEELLLQPLNMLADTVGAAYWSQESALGNVLKKLRSKAGRLTNAQTGDLDYVLTRLYEFANLTVDEQQIFLASCTPTSFMGPDGRPLYQCQSNPNDLTRDPYQAIGRYNPAATYSTENVGSLGSQSSPPFPAYDLAPPTTPPQGYQSSPPIPPSLSADPNSVFCVFRLSGKTLCVQDDYAGSKFEWILRLSPDFAALVLANQGDLYKVIDWQQKPTGTQYIVHLAIDDAAVTDQCSRPIQRPLPDTLVLTDPEGVSPGVTSPWNELTATKVGRYTGGVDGIKAMIFPDGVPESCGGSGGMSATPPSTPQSLSAPLPTATPIPLGVRDDECCDFPIDIDTPLAFLFSRHAATWRQKAIDWIGVPQIGKAKSLRELTAMRIAADAAVIAGTIEAGEGSVAAYVGKISAKSEMSEEPAELTEEPVAGPAEEESEPIPDDGRVVRQGA